MLGRRLILESLLFWLVAASAALSAEIPWKTNSYQQMATNRPVADILRDFAADQGISIVVSQKTIGTFSGQFGPMPPHEFLEQISRTGGLIWYFDGQALYVYRSDEIQSQVTKLRFTDTRKVIRSLEQLGISTKRFPLKTIAEDGVIFVSGPPRYVELVGKTIEMLESGGRTKADSDLAVGVYRLHHAWADDRTLYLRNRQIVVPGVATILQNVLANQRQSGKPNSGKSEKSIPQSRPGLLGQGLASSGREPQPGLPTSLQPGTDKQTQPSENNSETSTLGDASVQADSRLNAVVVRDVREKLPAYEAIIKSLDQPGGLVEITASIIDVDATSGFDWKPPDVSKWNYNGQANIATFSINSTATGQPPPTNGSGNIVASLTTDNVTQFYQSMTLLQKEGLAKTIAKPTVLTINNVEAFLDNTESVYVRVAGSYATDLYNVTVGTMLQITPHIIEKDGGCRVQLIVEVQDGNFEDITTDDIPRVKQNTISTQAVLDEGCSLLIGGLRRTEKKHTVKQVPVLGNIPVVGNLFKTISDSCADYDRVVLISPRIIDLPTPQLPDANQEQLREPETVPTPNPLRVPDGPSLGAQRDQRDIKQLSPASETGDVILAFPKAFEPSTLSVRQTSYDESLPHPTAGRVVRLPPVNR